MAGEVRCQLLFACLTLCDPMDCSLPGSSVHRDPQARILEWVAMLFSRGSSRPRHRTWVSRIAGRFFFFFFFYHLSHQGSYLWQNKWLFHSGQKGTYLFEYRQGDNVTFLTCTPTSNHRDYGAMKKNIKFIILPTPKVPFWK